MSGLSKHSLTIAGHRTSVTLEDAFWDELKRQAALQGRSLNRLVADIDANRTESPQPGNLSSAIRLYVLEALCREAGR
jgi:predicted DNA-binding ribbon-helix-helix protein